MKKKIYSMGISALLSFPIICATSCTGDFDTINTNNNSAATGTADLFLPHGIQSAVDIYWGGSLGMDIGDGYSQPELAVIAVAIAAGSIILSHVNDGGFWIVSRYFNLTVKQTLATWTVLETVLSVTGFAAAAVAWAIV